MSGKRAIRGIFRDYRPTEEDLRKAAEIPRHECPRRYCWWWRTLGFDWEKSAAEGCELPTTRELAYYRGGDIPCCRAVPSSGVDHYESRTPCLIEDGFERRRFVNRPPASPSPRG
jgi:hypothetical protein